MKHGTASAYCHHKCRCDTCRAFIRNYMREYRGSVTRTEVPTSPRARMIAAERLIERHQAEFQRLLEDEVASEVTA